MGLSCWRIASRSFPRVPRKTTLDRPFEFLIITTNTHFSSQLLLPSYPTLSHDSNASHQMTSLDLSPRAAKRRKTNSKAFADADEPDLPLAFHSRALRTVKQAVYGKAKTNKFAEALKEESVSPIRTRNVKSTPKGQRLVKESLEVPRTASAEDEGVGEGLTKDMGGRGDRKSKKQKIEKKELRSANKDRTGEEEDERTPIESPMKKNRKRFKGWVWLDEVNDLIRGENEDDVAGQLKGVNDRKEDDRDELNHGPTERDSDAEGSIRGSGRLTRRTKETVARGEGDKGAEAVATPASRRQRERKVEGDKVEKVDGKPTSALRQNNDPRPGRDSTENVAAFTTSNSRRKRDLHAQEDRSTIVDAVDISTSRSYKGRKASKREVERARGDVPIRQAEAHDGNVGPRISTDTEVSPDELNQDGLEEELDISEVPTSNSRKKRGKAAPAPTVEESPTLGAVQDPTTHASPLSDAKDLLESYTSELRPLLSQDLGALTEVKTHILSGLTGKRCLPLVSLSSPYQKVHQLVSQTVLAGEGNSMLIIGSRGTGKTTLIETVISDLSASHQDGFHVVRLNGFFHTDDKLALREIWRQLGREMDVENDDLGGSRSSYADTLTSLLALLTHSASSEDDDQPTTRKSKSIIFILDEFHLFTTHPRQTLLYNLFDTAQSHAAPICVFGLTTNLAVPDALEKRVKSRFSQRYVHLSLPRTFTDFEEICLKALQYHPSHADLLKKNGKSDMQHLSRLWNTYMHHLLSTTELSTLLHSIYTTQKSIPTFLSSALLPISSLSPSNPLPTPTSFSPSHTSTLPLLSPPDSPHLALLPSLSTLQLSLLIAAARLETIYETPLPGFEAVYEEYVALASKAKVKSGVGGLVGGGAGGRVWGKEVARGAWEGLVKLGMVGERQGRRRGMCEVGLGELGSWVEGEGRGFVGGVGLGRWCREI